MEASLAISADVGIRAREAYIQTVESTRPDSPSQFFCGFNLLSKSFSFTNTAFHNITRTRGKVPAKERKKYVSTRSLGALPAPTSRWRPFAPLDFVLHASGAQAV